MNTERFFGMSKEQRLFVLYLSRRKREQALSYRYLEKQTSISHSMLEKLFLQGIYKGISFDKMCRLLACLGISPSTASQVLGIKPVVEREKEREIAEAAMKLYLLQTQNRIAIVRMIDFEYNRKDDTG